MSYQFVVSFSPACCDCSVLSGCCDVDSSFAVLRRKKKKRKEKKRERVCSRSPGATPCWSQRTDGRCRRYATVAAADRTRYNGSPLRAMRKT